MIKEKDDQFNSMVEKVHGIDVSEPLIAGSTITFTMKIDMNMKGRGHMKSPELCVSQISDGKIVAEQFFV